MVITQTDQLLEKNHIQNTSIPTYRSNIFVDISSLYNWTYFLWDYQPSQDSFAPVFKITSRKPSLTHYDIAQLKTPIDWPDPSIIKADRCFFENCDESKSNLSIKNNRYNSPLSVREVKKANLIYSLIKDETNFIFGERKVNKVKNINKIEIFNFFRK